MQATRNRIADFAATIKLPHAYAMQDDNTAGERAPE
jgi:hypothetical protein